ncbi:MAG: D-alanine--D-alanine ligase [Phycisphaerae bacterium]|nr:D-alanine--D-alanine ligase [Phycisphaerae bacterium]
MEVFEMEDVVKRELYDITVLMGGPSNEREVSLLSGDAVAKALESAGHRVTRADITPRNTSALDRPGMDIAFIALHGEFGESGELQQICEEKGVRYTGSPPRASRLGMDKAAAKQILLRADIATPEWMILEKFHSLEDVGAWLKEITPPVIVKPVDGGSSLDVYLCPDLASRDDALEDLLDTYGRAMVEECIAGRELTVGILGAEALPIIEILPSHRFYDYDAKYADDAGTQYHLNPDLPDDVAQRVKNDAVKAHRTLGCKDLSRVDFILDKDNVPQFLEINTIPGFTSHSLVPMAARQAGMTMPDLCDRIVRLAMQRQMCPSA